MTSTAGKDDWSKPVSDDDAVDEPDSPIDESGGASLAEATAPPSGVGAPGSEVKSTAAADGPSGARGPNDPPVDDEREHPADFAPDGYDERQEDATPGARRETPDEVDRDELDREA